MQQFVLVAEYAHLPHQCQHLREDCGIGCTLYSHVQWIDEYRVEYGVEHHGEYRGIHCLAGFPGCSEHGVHSEIHVGEHVSQQHYHHIVFGIGQSLFACTEEIKDRVEKQQRNDAECQSDDEVQRHGVSQYPLCRVVVFLSEFH